MPPYGEFRMLTSISLIRHGYGNEAFERCSLVRTTHYRKSYWTNDVSLSSASHAELEFTVIVLLGLRLVYQLVTL
jgi:hypothetical protein